jgi:hypothetical protein
MRERAALVRKIRRYTVHFVPGPTIYSSTAVSLTGDHPTLLQPKLHCPPKAVEADGKEGRANLDNFSEVHKGARPTGTFKTRIAPLIYV